MVQSGGRQRFLFRGGRGRSSLRVKEMNDMSFFGFGMSIFPILFFGVFLLVFAVILSTLLKGIGQWNRNNKAPVLNVLATVVGKRENYSYHGHHDNITMASGSTSYFVTFEVESGDRMEFQVSGQEYGLMVEQDFGTLKFQGTRFLGFERE